VALSTLMAPSISSGQPGSSKGSFHAKPWVGSLAVVLLAVVPALGFLLHRFVFDSLLIIQE